MRPLIYPDRLTFSDLFERWEPYRPRPSGGRLKDVPFSIEAPLSEMGRRERAEFGMRIGLFCSAQLNDRRPWFHVWPHAHVAEAIFANTIHIDGEYMSFQIIQGNREDRALVICQHGRIIGGPWVAHITLDSIPEVPQ